MVFLPDDICAIILARLPIKAFTSCKLVCKQWNSVVGSQFFRHLFISQHQNSQSSWSLISGGSDQTEFLAHYRCDTWGLERSLGSYISSFITDMFENKKDKYRRGRVVAYSDAGLILIDVSSYSCAGLNFEKRSMYVANPVSRECIEIAPPKAFESNGIFWPFGLTTRTDNGGVLGYKIVVYSSEKSECNLRLMIYSSETGLWSPNLCLSSNYDKCQYCISLKGNLHWLSRRHYSNDEVVVSMDFDATTMASDPCRVTPFPDNGKLHKFERACTTCQGNLMYMNIVSQDNSDGSVEHNLCVWRLKSWEWQLISEISTALIGTNFDYIPLRINPFDATTAFFRSQKDQCLVAINLLHNELHRSNSGRILSSVNCPGGSKFHSFVLPQWLHRIPRPTW